MNTLKQLNFPHYAFRLHTGGKSVRIWDAIRQQWLVLTPEEWVRQHLIRYLIEERGAVAGFISQEYPVTLGGTHQRADVVITGRDGKICLLAECKAPEVLLDTAVWAQAIRYNSTLQAPFVILTNGVTHRCGHLDTESGRYLPLNDFPDLSHFFGIQQL